MIEMGNPTWVNLTPHTVNIHKPSGEIVTVEPSGLVMRADPITEEARSIDGIPLIKMRLGTCAVHGSGTLPVDRSTACYLVSLIALRQLEQQLTAPQLLQYFAPDTGPESVVRDSEGRIVGVKRLIVPEVRDA